MIAIYDQDAPFPVYCRDCWLSDKWDVKTYGQDFDFSKPFFEQFATLLQKVPKLAVINELSENCEFTHFSHKNKNCYLLVGTSECEDSLFCYRTFYAKDCIDCDFLLGGELCYECLECEKLYDCTHCIRCKNSQNLYVCHDCQNCKNCFGCTNLRNKEFCWGNQQLSPEEFKKRLKEQTRSWEKFEALRRSGIFRATKLFQCEHCTGDNVENAKNCHQCFDIAECENCSYCASGTKDANCADTEFIDNSQWCWNGASHELNNNCICCAVVWYSHDMTYCENCVSSHNLFGCIGMRHAEYCILNKPYSKEEYFALRERIIEHMKSTNEWGEYFPFSITPLAYNETIAQDYFPLTKEEVFSFGSRWKEKQKNDYKPSSSKEILSCEACDKNYKIQKQELKFYKKMGLPLPEKCSACRYHQRMKLRNPRQLWDRKCDNCSAEIKTTFAPGRPEKVSCEKCYLNAVD